jgi:hypothetical protein
MYRKITIAFAAPFKVTKREKVSNQSAVIVLGILSTVWKTAACFRRT